MNSHRIVIAGAGYAGVSCALRLARRVPAQVSVTLVSATDRFIERIRLHQRATGQSVGDWNLRALISGSGVDLHIGSIEQLDYGNRMLKLGSGRLEFDTLVFALGSHVDVDGVKGVREHAMAVGCDSSRTGDDRRRRLDGHRAGVRDCRIVPGSAGLARQPGASRGVVVRSGAHPCARGA